MKIILAMVGAVTKKHFGDEDAGIQGDVKEYL